MRLLIITGHFAGPERQPWLLDDLAAALLRAGNEVDVLVLDATSPHLPGLAPVREPGLSVFSVGATSVPHGAWQKFRSYLGTAFRAHTQGHGWLRTRQYDLCIFTSIASFHLGVPGRMRRAGIAKRVVLILWDFFPVHQLEIGRLKTRRLARVMKWIERKAIESADVVALMTPANVRFLKRYHPGIVTTTVEIPPWSGASLESSPESIAARLAEPRLRVIFGGQLAPGRGVDALITAASRLPAGAGIDVFIAGDGPDRGRLERIAADSGAVNVRFLGSLPRDEYRALARTMHVGVAITVPGVSAPSFPSKIVEYSALGLATLVCVEPASDAGEIVVASGAGLAAPVGDADAITRAMHEFAHELASGSIAARFDAAERAFEERFSVDRAAQALMQLAE